MHRHIGFLAGHGVIRDLARQTGASYEEALVAYECEVKRLESDATVATYIPVIARRRAKEALSHRHH